MSLKYQEPQHECPACGGPTAPPLGCLPWKDTDDDGREMWRGDTCPWADLEDAGVIIGLYRDWPHATPVTTGRAPWITDAYYQAMHAARFAFAEQEFKAGERARRKGK